MTVENGVVADLATHWEKSVAFAGRLVNNPWFKLGASVSLALLLNSLDDGIRIFDHVKEVAAQSQNPYDLCDSSLTCSVGPDGFTVDKPENTIVEIPSLFNSFRIGNCGDSKVWSLDAYNTNNNVFPINPSGQVEFCGKEIDQQTFAAGLDRAVAAALESKEPLNKFQEFYNSTWGFVTGSLCLSSYILFSIAAISGRAVKKMKDEIEHPFDVFDVHNDQ